MPKLMIFDIIKFNTNIFDELINEFLNNTIN